MFFSKKLEQLDQEYVDETCKVVLSELMQNTDFGAVWRFNGMSFRLGGDSDVPRQLVEEVVDEIRRNIDSLIDGNLKSWLMEDDFFRARNGLLGRENELTNLLASRSWSEGDDQYAGAAIQFVVARLLYILVRFEESVKLLDDAKIRGGTRKLMDTSLRALAAITSTTLGGELPTGIRAYLPRVTAAFLASGLVK